MISCMCTWHSMHRIQYGTGKAERKETRMTCIQFHKIYVRFMKIKIRRLNTSRGLLEKMPSSTSLPVKKNKTKCHLKMEKLSAFSLRLMRMVEIVFERGSSLPHHNSPPHNSPEATQARQQSPLSVRYSSQVGKEEPKSDDDDEVNRDWNLNSLFSRLSLWHWQQTKVDQLEASGASGGYEISLNSSLRLF